MTVVGGDELYVVGLAVLDNLVVNLLFLETVPLNLQVKVVLKDILQTLNRLTRFIVLSGKEIVGYLSLQASGGGDQSLAVFAQKLNVNPRLVIHALQVGLGQ